MTDSFNEKENDGGVLDGNATDNPHKTGQFGLIDPNWRGNQHARNGEVGTSNADAIGDPRDLNLSDLGGGAERPADDVLSNDALAEAQRKGGVERKRALAKFANDKAAEEKEWLAQKEAEKAAAEAERLALLSPPDDDLWKSIEAARAALRAEESQRREVLTALPEDLGTMKLSNRLEAVADFVMGKGMVNPLPRFTSGLASDAGHGLVVTLNRTDANGNPQVIGVPIYVDTKPSVLNQYLPVVHPQDVSVDFAGVIDGVTRSSSLPIISDEEASESGLFPVVDHAKSDANDNDQNHVLLALIQEARANTHD